MPEEKHDDLFKFLRAISEAEDKGEHIFICPICGGKSEVYRVKYNNHIIAWCNACGIKVMS